MQKQIVALSLFLFASLFVLVSVSNTQAQRDDAGNGWRKTPAQVLPTDYKFSGPYTHKNLTVYLIHGANKSTGKAPLTLQEAMAQKKVRVIETGDVNQLAIQNLSHQEVFIQSGDIVKGGQQDRVLAMDLLVPPRSGRISIDSFCVEQGRWQQRGKEMVSAFSSSDQMLNHKDLKIAAKSKNSQGEVWAKVSESQAKLSKNVVVASGRIGNRGGGAMQIGGGAGNGGAGGAVALGQPPAMSEAATVEVTSSASRTSLQLTLENKVVKETADDYIKALSSAITGKTDVIGYAFAINGQINSADVYSSHALFVKLWPKLLKSSAVEAIAEFDKAGKTEAVTENSVKTFLAEAEAGKAEEKQVTTRVAMEKRESDKHLFFETRDRKNGEQWLHRNYLKK
ncbi:MAG: hypothetical protein JST84_23900 [Acidobacteria bacterium]|nr:hypothetical protein [Acidobacteriota bacterium]